MALKCLNGVDYSFLLYMVRSTHFMLVAVAVNQIQMNIIVISVSI